ncbi:MAG: biliverdin-producing heme oxygenase [Chitinophagaceae bacterium]
MLSTILKNQTKEAHQSLEAVVVKRIKSIRSKDEYVALLHKFYGFHFPMEKKYDQFFSDNSIPFYSKRRKADLILHDLDELGMNNKTILLADHLPLIDSIDDAFGSYYVLEGSTQGGSIVADMLIKYAGLTPATTSFFNVYGDQKKEMWQSFKEKMDASVASQSFDKTVAAANSTFDLFKQWMSTPNP